MSNIEKISEQLSAYLDGELSDEESRRVDEMLVDDPALSDELESLREVRQLLQGLPREQAPDGLLDTVLAQAQRRRTGWWAGRLARAAIILLAVGVGVTVTSWLNRPGERSGTQTPQTPTLARSGLTGIGGTAPEEVTNVLINTDNLVLTQHEVEGVFGRNSIEPVVAKEAAWVAKDASNKHRSRANFYHQRQVAPNQIRYELAITDNQMRQIVSELNEIRARQNVAQCPAGRRVRNGDDTIALAKADLRDESATGAARSAEYAKIRHAAARRTRNEATARPRETDPTLAHVAKPSTGPTTIPASIAMEQRKTSGISDQKVVSRQPTTALATANVRQLVVILNVVGAK
ncbi:MAG: zf-HC2 domain-containing protein [Phycisphaerae bacterium]|nr:zf-HC2 domain-containing protein [Phycisphaerae bacterium]